MRRIEISQWSKRSMCEMLQNGTALRIEVREIGLPISTHFFDAPPDASSGELMDALIKFFGPLEDKVGNTYYLTQ